MFVLFLFYKFICMIVRLYIVYFYLKLVVLFLNVIVLFLKFWGKKFMYVINKCVFLWKLKDFSNNIFIDNVSSRLIIVFV